jgi:hypothetical protein
VASPPGSPPGASAGNELNRGQPQGRSSRGNRPLREEIDDETIERWAGYLKSTLQFVKNRMSRVSGVMKAMGMRRPAVVLLWEGLLEALSRLNAQAAAAAAAARAGGQPARPRGDGEDAPAGPLGGRGADAPAAAPAGDAAAAEAPAFDLPADQALWDRGVEHLLDQPDAVDGLAAEDPSGSLVYWAALIAASQVDRGKVRLRPRPEASDPKRRRRSRG